MPDLIKIRRKEITAGVPPTTVAGDEGEILANLVDRKVFVRNATGVPVLVADRALPYNAARQYALDDLTIQANVLYRCTTAITVPEAFNAAKWTAVGGAGGGDLTGAVILAPASTARNTITPTGNFTPLTILPAGGQSLSLLNINGTRHDPRGIPVGRYGEAVFLVSQASHPFTAIGQPAAFNAGNWVLASATSATLAVRAVVHEIIDANNVLLQMSGQVKNLSPAAFVGGAIVDNTTYYLSATAGQLSATPAVQGAQATLLVTSISAGPLGTGLLLLSNAAGAAIVSRGPAPQGQTIYEPLSVLDTASANGLKIAPNSQSIASTGGTPISLTFQQDGILALGGGLRMTGIPVVAAAVPAYQLEDTNETAPAGRFRWAVDGNSTYLQHMATVGPPATWATIWHNTATSFVIAAPYTFTPTSGINSPLMIPTAADVDGSTAMNIGIARSWLFGQFGVDSGAGLEMRPTTAGKSMRIMDADRINGIRITPATRTLTALGGDGSILVTGNFGVTGELASTGLLSVPSAAIGAFQINVSAGVFKRTSGSIVYDVPTGFQHLLRINNVGAATVDPPGTTTPGVLTIITAEKGDFRFLNKALGGTVAGATTFSAAANFTGGLTSELIRIGIKATNKIDVPTGSLAFDVPSGSVYVFEVADAEIARISNSSTISGTMLLTATVGDARYPQLVNGRVPIAEGGTAANDVLEARVNLGADNASNLTQGTIPYTRLGTDGNYRNWVLARIADASHGVEGTYGFMECPDTLSPGSNHSGSVLEWAGVRTGHTSNSGVHPSGQWKAMGHMGTSNDDHATLFMRIS